MRYTSPDFTIYQDCNTKVSELLINMTSLIWSCILLLSYDCFYTKSSDLETQTHFVVWAHFLKVPTIVEEGSQDVYGVKNDVLSTCVVSVCFLFCFWLSELYWIK